MIDNNLIAKHLYTQIAELITKARESVARHVNQTMLYSYYEIGRMIVEDEQKGEERAEYGKRVLQALSDQLTQKFGKGFSVSNLEQMRMFFLVYSKSQTLSGKFQSADNEEVQAIKTLPDFQLSWSHYLKLMRIDDPQERKFYEIESFSNNWSLREMQRQYDSALYQRLVLSRDKERVKDLSIKGQLLQRPEDTVKDPYILEFLGLPENSFYSESDIEQRLINKLEHFLLELGKGFAFIGRQVRFTFNEKHFRVDLVFYNRILKSFVLIDLKIGEISHQDIGQMQMYVNYYDRFVKLPEENKTIGIVLCRDKDETLVEITLPENNTQIFASLYKTVLPSKEELKQLIENKNQ
ncbi:MAG: DUF1016 domain-containing protein [Porphyromonadaceae bacterium]|nr:MAG: DUF1016 domain-containing protein [Porphyromonadaceae bacterium]